jgi:hypothetical protein
MVPLTVSSRRFGQMSIRFQTVSFKASTQEKVASEIFRFG